MSIRLMDARYAAVWQLVGEDIQVPFTLDYHALVGQITATMRVAVGCDFIDCVLEMPSGHRLSMYKIFKLGYTRLALHVLQSCECATTEIDMEYFIEWLVDQRTPLPLGAYELYKGIASNMRGLDVFAGEIFAMITRIFSSLTDQGIELVMGALKDMPGNYAILNYLYYCMYNEFLPIEMRTKMAAALYSCADSCADYRWMRLDRHTNMLRDLCRKHKCMRID